MKKFAAIVLALVLALACVSALADETYTHFFSQADLAGETGGFVAGTGMVEMNTLVLKDDGTYEYTKLTGSLDENGEVTVYETGRYEIRFVFTGNYTREGDQVLLDNPVECVFSEDWGPLVELGYMTNTSGTASNGDLVYNYSVEDKRQPLDYFASPFYKDQPFEAPVSITLNADGTFNYNAVANSDDD